MKNPIFYTATFAEQKYLDSTFSGVYDQTDLGPELLYVE
jgi:hypothetical protein